MRIYNKNIQIMRWFFELNRYNDDESDIIGLTYKVKKTNFLHKNHEFSHTSLIFLSFFWMGNLLKENLPKRNQRMYFV